MLNLAPPGSKLSEEGNQCSGSSHRRLFGLYVHNLVNQWLIHHGSVIKVGEDTYVQWFSLSLVVSPFALFPNKLGCEMTLYVHNSRRTGNIFVARLPVSFYLAGCITLWPPPSVKDDRTLHVFLEEASLAGLNRLFTLDSIHKDGQVITCIYYIINILK